MKTIKELLRGRYSSTDIYSTVNDWLEILLKTIYTLPEGELSDTSKSNILILLSAMRKDVMLLENDDSYSDQSVTITLHFRTLENALRTGVLRERDELIRYADKFVFKPLEKILAGYLDTAAAKV